MLRSVLKIHLKDYLFWTDSQAVLKYIANDKARFYTYVANRVSFIRDNTSTQQWRYVTSKNNPADDASSGVSLPMFLESKWWICGLEFLWEPEHSWPMEGYKQESLTQNDPEVKSCTVMCKITTQDQQNPTDKLLSYFSDSIRLLKAVAWYQKFGDILLIFAAERKELEANIRTCAHHQKVTSQLHVFKPTLSGQHLYTKDLGRAEKAVVIFIQWQAFPNEFAKLKTPPHNVQRKSTIYKLDPKWLRSKIVTKWITESRRMTVKCKNV